MSQTDLHANSNATRFAFGRNWRQFVRRNFTEERLTIAQSRILAFMGRSSLAGFDFLDIGCGSGLHSYAAFRSGAERVFAFDYDSNSVLASQALHKHAGLPSNWTIERGDILDDAYVAKLGKWNFVYSWGVLHHTGDVWRAIRSAQRTVADNGYFYLALYAADVQPRMQFWLNVKKKYNASNWLQRRLMVMWYCWEIAMQKEIRRLPELVRRILSYRFERGMSYFADVRDWLGGWPMEFVYDQDVVDLLEGEYGFKLVNVATGQACSEYLFQKTGLSAVRSNVKAIVSVKDFDTKTLS